jgi:hypothetical protein
MRKYDLDTFDGDSEAGKVFLSYSRRDRERTQRIADVLRARHFGVFKDTDDILPTEEWKTRLEQLIAEADTIVFLLSPHSVASEVCKWEVEYAASLNKRIAPIVITEVDTTQIPPLLARLNFIFCTERDPFEDAVDSLVSALGTDIEWVREHTRLGSLAQRWDAADGATRLLLRGQDITDAETWRDGHSPEAPSITAQQAAFISESRKSAVRRQRRIVAGSLSAVVVAVGLAGLAYWQRDIAVRNEIVAKKNEIEAKLNGRRGYAALSREAVAKERYVDATKLALAAIKRSDVDPIPTVSEAVLTLGVALRSMKTIRSRYAIAEAESRLKWWLRGAAIHNGHIAIVYNASDEILKPKGPKGRLVIYDVDTLEPIYKMFLPVKTGDRLRLSRDGTVVALRTKQEHPVVLDLRNKKTLTKEIEWSKSDNSGSRSRWPYDIRILAESKTQILETDPFGKRPTGALAKKRAMEIIDIDNRRLSAIAISPNLKLLALAISGTNTYDQSKSFEIYDLETNSLIYKRRIEQAIWKLGFTRDSRRISVVYGDDKYRLRPEKIV